VIWKPQKPNFFFWAYRIISSRGGTMGPAAAKASFLKGRKTGRAIELPAAPPWTGQKRNFAVNGPSGGKRAARRWRGRAEQARGGDGGRIGVGAVGPGGQKKGENGNTRHSPAGFAGPPFGGASYPGGPALKKSGKQGGRGGAAAAKKRGPMAVVPLGHYPIWWHTRMAGKGVPRCFTIGPLKERSRQYLVFSKMFRDDADPHHAGRAAALPSKPPAVLVSGPPP